MDPLPEKHIAKHSSIERRVAGNHQELGKLNRIGGDGPSPQRRHESHRSKRKARRHHRGRVLQRWVIALVSLVGVSLVGLVVLTLFRQKNPELPTLSGSSLDSSPKGVPLVSSSRGVDLGKRLLACESVEDLDLIIRPGAVPADRGLELLAELRAKSSPDLEPIWLGIGHSEVADMLNMLVDFGPGDRRLIALTPDSGGRWEVDFDSFAHHCQPPFGDLVDGKAEEGLVRVVVSRDFYFNGPYADEKQWSCFNLRCGGNSMLQLIGYCRRDSLTEKALERIESRNRHQLGDVLELSKLKNDDLLAKPPFRATLRIRHEGQNAVGQQWLISEVVADDWVIGEKTLEEIVATAPAEK